jgi:dienelactone hydrolase
VRRLLALAAACALVPAAPASAQDEAANRAKSGERAAEHQTPEYQAELLDRGMRNRNEAVAAAAADPERNFVGDVCWHWERDCAGDVRLYDFEEQGRGLVRPVLFTARNGSTVSGRVWATRYGPAKRPGIVITNGSIQAPETLYWWAAQLLAKSGYVVITFDPQQQGRSDGLGEGIDAQEGVPSQSEGNTFYDWTQDALDFLLSTPQKPYCARPSRSGTSHCAKQQRRVGEGRNAAFNPFWELVDGSRIGIAGHSYGASGVSWVGQQDPRVDAVVAWDALCAPTSADENASCLSGGQGPPPAPRVPSLDLTADYFTGNESTEGDDPQSKGAASREFSRAGVDSGSIAIRGGTHFEFSYLPTTTFRATLRGIHLAAWYTHAWFDRYVKEDVGAAKRLMTSRWRSDIGDREVDPAGGGNLFSWIYRSRMDLGRDGGPRFVCEDLRAGCAGMVDDDGGPRKYSYLDIVLAPDRPDVQAAGARGRCLSRRTVVLHLRGRRGLRVRRVVARARGMRVGRSHGRRVVLRFAGMRKGKVRVRLRVAGRARGRAVRFTVRRTYRLCTPKRARRN